MGKRGIGLEEKIWIDEAFLFKDDTLSPIFCKPKLIPLKTITMEKIEKMQQEVMEKLRIAEKEEQEEKENNEAEIVPDDPQSNDQKSTDVWTADD